MSTKPAKNKLEMSSDQLKAELVEIKERIGSLETIATISNKVVVEQHVRAHLVSAQSKALMRECSEPKTRQQLMEKFGHKTAQALDYHLAPLRDNNLIHQHFDEDGAIQTFQCSKLFRQLSKKIQKDILEN